MEIADITKKRIREYLSKGMRFDGRKPLDYRNITIETGISKKAEGSARVKIGDTEVLAGIKLGLADPFSDSPDTGVLMVTAEFSPMASEKFERGPPSIEAVELARVIDRGIREDEVIDLSKLCLAPGEKVWAVFVDIYPLNDSGNLIDASSLAALAALKSAVFPALIEKKNADEKTKIDYGNFTTKKLPISEHLPFSMTFYKIGDHFLLDPTTEEEEASDAYITLAVSSTKKGEFINAIQKGGVTPFTLEETEKVIDHAAKECKKLEAALEKAIK